MALPDGTILSSGIIAIVPISGSPVPTSLSFGTIDGIAADVSDYEVGQTVFYKSDTSFIISEQTWSAVPQSNIYLIYTQPV